MVPLPITSEIMLDMGMKQIRFTITTNARKKASQASFRSSCRLGFCTFTAAMLTPMASTNTMARAMRYGLHEFRTLITSSMFTLNMSFSSLCSYSFLELLTLM